MIENLGRYMELKTKTMEAETVYSQEAGYLQRAEIPDCTEVCPQAAIYVGSLAAAGERETLSRYVAAHPELGAVSYYVNGQNKQYADSSRDDNDNRTGYGGRNNNNEENRENSCETSSQAFLRLMEDVRTGKIQCIVTAHLDGFAKDYLETVYLIQNYFSYMNARFIAVEDDFDSDREEDRTRISEEVGKKMTDIRSRQNSKMRCENARKRVTRPDVMPTGTAPYGYLAVRDGDRKYYIPDPNTAPYVRMMFKWALLGRSSKQIADRMTLLGAPTPGQLRSGKAADAPKWEAHSVLKILQNPTYTGSICIGRMQQALYKSQPRRKLSPSEWTVREHSHEPLVTKEDFEEVQRKISQNRRLPRDN